MPRIMKVKKKSITQSQIVSSLEGIAEMSPLFMDTTCMLDAGSSSWEVIYKFFKDENLRVFDKQSAIADAPAPDAGAVWNDVANSFLHRIDARP